jgi:hypothetical protein
MTTMPYWMNKTPEMVAMDRYFSGPDLVNRYKKAITSINTSKPGNALPTTSDALNKELPNGVAHAFTHFGQDWLNKNNPSSGGNFWPHVPTFTIIPWIREGVLHAAHKGLGSTALATLGKSPTEIAKIFKSEKEDSQLTDAELKAVLPLVTTWVCTSPPGTGTIQVDAVRGPTVVELIIATPQPQMMHSRFFDQMRDIIDRQWIILHGGPATIDLVEHDEYQPMEA